MQYHPVQDLVATLESIVDREGLVHVMTALELMCNEKAMWVASTESIGQPDVKLGKLWLECGKACYKTAQIADKLP